MRGAAAERVRRRLARLRHRNGQRGIDVAPRRRRNPAWSRLADLATEDVVTESPCSIGGKVVRAASLPDESGAGAVRNRATGRRRVREFSPVPERVDGGRREAVIAGVVLGRRGAAGAACVRERVGQAGEIPIRVVRESRRRIGKRRVGEDVDAPGEVTDRRWRNAARIAVVCEARFAHHGAGAGRSASPHGACLHAVDQMERLVREVGQLGGARVAGNHVRPGG